MTTKPAKEWSPHIWEGCDLFAWLGLLVRNRFRVTPRKIYVAVIVTFVSATHTLLRWLQHAWYGSRLDQVAISHPPIFIIGHWRTGTTLLHELLILDPRHNFPNTYQCLDPNHFLLTEKYYTRLFRFLMPSRRPMDNMAAGFDRPQEDEFALCMLGQPSPYQTIAFPNHPPQGLEGLEVERLPPRAQKAWKQTFLRFLRQLTYRDPRRLVLKSPTHSWRIPTLLELFPEARFVHIVRNPYVVFPSTMNLWESLYETHGLQEPTFQDLEELVYSSFTHLYKRIEATRHLVRPDRFHELHYEDLVADPVSRMRQLYDQLELGDFEAMQPRLQEYLSSHAGYRTNRYPPLTPQQRAEIARRWGPVIERYGYAEPGPVEAKG